MSGMLSINFDQIAIFLIQGLAVSMLILVLFHIREHSGKGILYLFLGLLQSMQVFLGGTVYYEVADGFLVSPESTVLFVATLFAILLIYIKDDANEIRKIVYGLVLANLAIALLTQSFGWNIEYTEVYNPFNLTATLFTKNAWILILGSIILFLDSVLIIMLYEFTARLFNNLFLQILVTMLVVVAFDAVAFSSMAFWNSERLVPIIVSGTASKAAFGLFYSFIFYGYLRYFSKKPVNKQFFNFKDIFAPLTYRQKFEMAHSDMLKASEHAQRNETKYRTLADISPVGIFHASEDGHLTFVNSELCSIFGMNEGEILGLGWQTAIHRLDIDRLKQDWWNAINAHEPGKCECRILWKDGSVRWILGHVVPDPNGPAKTNGYVGTITDITELKEFQEKQVELRKEAQKSDRLKSAFLANMSHEIRTPMNGILGFSNLLKSQDLSGEEQQKYLKIIEESGSRMVNIIDNLINISKIESGTMDVNWQEVKLNRLFTDVKDVFLIDAEKKKLTLNMECGSPDGTDVLVSDPEKLYGVLTNLVKNAIKYTEAGSITFGYRKLQDIFEFYVRDTGIGIPKHRAGAIFESFVQADLTDKMAKQGAGLGLAIVKAYVNLLEGEISVQSQEFEGSVFTFKLPVKPKGAHSGSKKGLFGVELPTCPESDSKRNLKILVVDDDETSRQLLEIKLKGFGSELFSAANGEEVLELCRQYPDLDLIMMDIRLPGMNGYQVTEKIRETNRDVIIIAQTAFALSGDREKALEVGCNDHITKPLNMRLLTNLIQSYFPEEVLVQKS